MGRSEAGLTAACTVKQDLKRWQGSGVWLLALWQPQSWPLELLQINQLRIVTLLNLSSKRVTFRSLNKSGNKEKLFQGRRYTKDQRTRKEVKVKKVKGKNETHRERRGEKEQENKEKIKLKKEVNQTARKREMENKVESRVKIKQDEQRNQRKIKERGRE